jgi:tetratricopeptide (TPR) repeat protein
MLLTRIGLLSLVGVTLLGGRPTLGSPASVKWSKDAQPWAPALLRVEQRHRDLRRARLRIYADPDYRVTVPRWQERARAMVDDLNQFAGPTFGVRFEIESLRRWEGTNRGASTSQALNLLESQDPGEDVDWVIGFMPALPLLSTSQHEIGMARVLGRHCVLRGMADLEEARALDRSPDLGGTEKEQLYTVRKWHKEIAVFLHEWGHTLGAPHSRDLSDIMNGGYSHLVAGFSPAELKAMDLGLACRLGDSPVAAFRCRPLLDYLQKTDLPDWFSDSRNSLIKALTEGLAGAPAGPKDFDGRQGPELTAAQAKVFNVAVDLLKEAETQHKSGEVQAAVQSLSEAASHARTLTAGSGPIWLAIGERRLALGALSEAEEALARAGTEPGADQVRAELQRARRYYGLPASGRVPAGAEPEYVRAFDQALKTLDEPAAPALGAALKTYAGAPGLLMLDCESCLRARRYRQARIQCQAAIDEFPELARAHYLLGLTHLNEGRRSEAVIQLRAAVELAPHERVHWQALGSLYRVAGKRDDLRSVAAEYQQRFGAQLP